MQTMTYRTLDARANRLANTPGEAGLHDEMAVGILMGQKLNHVVAQLPGIGASVVRIIWFPPRTKESILLNDFFELLRDAGYALDRLDYSAWVERVLHDSRMEDSLVPSLPRELETIALDLTRLRAP
jgi:hypothetical protein